jgi:hypothetical protein
MANQSRIYPVNHSAAELAKAVFEAGGPQLDPSVEVGTVTYDHVKIQYTFTGPNVVIEILDKPWEDPYAIIWGKMDKFMASE